LPLKQGYQPKVGMAGRHTTRSVELYQLPEGGYIADSRFFRRWKCTADISLKTPAILFLGNVADYIDKCKFKRLLPHHRTRLCSAAGCGEGIIPKSRHESYKAMYEEARQIKNGHRK
jgi:ribosome biogenesis GTPase